MSAARRSGRFSYLTSTPESAQTNPAEDGSATESIPTTDSSDEGEGRSPGSSKDGLVIVPKGQGRMKQERSQLNVRIPTTLKRQASAKAVLEGRDIGEVVEVLLREYLNR